MLTPVFNGRVPVFIGDDVTDHDGFAAVASAGGIALDVAIAFDNRPALVREWLHSFAGLNSIAS
jgi:trehalose 6-phosphate phosphatase